MASVAAIPRIFELLKKKTLSTGSAVSYEASDSSTPRSESPALISKPRKEILPAVRLVGRKFSDLLTKNYKLHEKLGDGGFGVVFRATKVNDPNQEVAVKIIFKDSIHRKNMDSELGNIPIEAFVLKRLNHANIVRMIDFYQCENFFYIVTELAGSKWQKSTSKAAARDLFEAVDSRGGLTEKQTQHVFRQLGAAIKYLHVNCGLVHRDIKDENICVDAHLNIKLIDFGSVARFAPASATQDNYFERCHGTLSYYSPEQVRGELYRGPEAEMWSIGCLLYTCLRNEAPFADHWETLNRDPTVGMERIVSPGCLDLMRGLLNKDSAKRFDIGHMMRHPWLTEHI